MENSLEIGTATMVYDKNGVATQASFTPSLKVDIDKNVLIQLSTVKGNSESMIKDNAGLILATWFSKLNEIELADRDEWEIATKMVNCEKYPNGNVKKCELKFVFRKLQTNLN